MQSRCIGAALLLLTLLTTGTARAETPKTSPGSGETKTGCEVEKKWTNLTLPTEVHFDPGNAWDWKRATAGRGGGVVTFSTIPPQGLGAIKQSDILVGLTDYMIERANAELSAWAIQNRVDRLCKVETRPGEAPLPGAFLEETCKDIKRNGVGLLFDGPTVLQNSARADTLALMKNLGEVSVVYGNGQKVGAADIGSHDMAMALAVLGRVVELSLLGQRTDVAFASFAGDGLWVDDVCLAAGGNCKALDQATGDNPVLAQLGQDYPVTTSLWLVSAILATLPEGELHVEKAEDVPRIAGAIAKALMANIESAGMSQAVRALLPGGLEANLQTVVESLINAEGRPSIRATYQDIEKILTEIKGLSDPDQIEEKRAVMLQKYGQLIKESLGFIHAAVVQVGKQAPNDPITKRAKVLERIGALAAQIAEGRYGMALAEGVALAEQYVLHHIKEKCSSEDLETPGVIQIPPDDSHQCLFPTQLSSELVRGVAFVFELGQAESAQAAHDIIANWAAPVGSYQRKHDGSGTSYVGLNGYVGLSGGAEWMISPEDEPILSRRAGQAAPSVLVGMDWGHRRKNQQYIGFFFSVLDLGAVATTRIERDNTTSADTGTEAGSEDTSQVEYASKLQFQQVFSPGLYLTWAPCSMPLAFGVGANLAPALREISEGGEIIERDVPAFRASLLVGLDLPLNP